MRPVAEHSSRTTADALSYNNRTDSCPSTRSLLQPIKSAWFRASYMAMKSLTSLRQMASMVGRMPHMPHVDVASIRSHMPKMSPKTLLTRDYPEVLLLYGWLGFAACIGVYSMKKVLFDNDAGSYLNVNMRGDIDRQFGEKVGTEDGGKAGSVTTPWSTKHTLWWKLAQVKTDDNGANIGVLWDNRARPHQYSKPGELGVGSGLTMTGL